MTEGAERERSREAGRREVEEKDGERKLEGGGECQMVGLEHSVNDSRLQKEGHRGGGAE